MATKKRKSHETASKHGSTEASSASGSTKTTSGCGSTTTTTKEEDTEIQSARKMLCVWKARAHLDRVPTRKRQIEGKLVTRRTKTSTRSDEREKDVEKSLDPMQRVQRMRTTLKTQPQNPYGHKLQRDEFSAIVGAQGGVERRG